jgi:hypothetical protein
MLLSSALHNPPAIGLAVEIYDGDLKMSLKEGPKFETVDFRCNREITIMSAVDFLSGGAEVFRNQVLNLELTGAHLPSSADQSLRLPKNGLRLTAGAARGARALMRAQHRRRLSGWRVSRWGCAVQDKNKDIKNLKNTLKQREDALKAEKRALEVAKTAMKEAETKANVLQEDLKSAKQMNLELRSQLASAKEQERRQQEHIANRKWIARAETPRCCCARVSLWTFLSFLKTV